MDHAALKGGRRTSLAGANGAFEPRRRKGKGVYGVVKLKNAVISS